MHPNHMLRAMVEDRRRQVSFEAGALRRGGPVPISALPDRIVRLARRVAVSRHAPRVQTVAGPIPAAGPRT